MQARKLATHLPAAQTSESVIPPVKVGCPGKILQVKSYLLGYCQNLRYIRQKFNVLHLVYYYMHTGIKLDYFIPAVHAHTGKLLWCF